MRVWPSTRSFCSLLLGIACLSTAEADLKVQINVEPTFLGIGYGNGSYIPYSVEIVNEGSSADGVLRVTATGFQMDYPVSLPRGSKKRLTCYLSDFAMGDMTLDLSTNQGSVRRTWPLELQGDAQSYIGMISDYPGDLSFLKGHHGSDSRTVVGDAYVTPDRAPTRSIGYGVLTALVLGSGSERLSADAITAIHQWVVSGGTLVMIGGASNPVLADPRWKDLLPIDKAVSKNLTGSRLLTRLGKANLKEQFSVLAGVPVDAQHAQKENGVTLIAERPFGLGKVVFLAFNPFEQPFKMWDGRYALFTELANRRVALLGQVFFSSVSGQSGNEEGYYGYSGSGTSYADDLNDPFRTHLPPTAKVAWILVGYFIVVVPLNMLILRKLKRGELAWFTTPIISLAFAAAFFSSAKDLYAIGLSRSTVGGVAMQEGCPYAVFQGRAQMFFPQGGRYDLKMEGVQAVSSSEANYDFRAAQDETLAELQPVDTGTVHVPSMNTPNLAFREFRLTQTLEVDPIVELEEVAGTLKITNRSGKAIQGAALYTPTKIYRLGTIAPEEVVKVNSNTNHEVASSEQSQSILTKIAQRRNVCVVSGVTDTLNLGPQIGKSVTSGTGVTFALVTLKGRKL